MPLRMTGAIAQAHPSFANGIERKETVSDKIIGALKKLSSGVEFKKSSHQSCARTFQTVYVCDVVGDEEWLERLEELLGTKFFLPMSGSASIKIPDDKIEELLNEARKVQEDIERSIK